MGKVSLHEKLVMTEYSRVPGSGIIRQLTPGLEMTIRDLRTLMMMISDNTATDMIVDLVGKENVNETMLQLGLENTNISTCREILFETAGLSDISRIDRTYKLYYEKTQKRKEEKGPRKVERTLSNTTTPRDWKILLEKVYRGEAASRNSCDDIIDLMKRCQTGANRLRKYLPRDEVEVAHKTGTVRGVVNDVGIVFPKEKEPYVICGLSKELADNSDGEEAIATVSKIVYEYFT
jgi:beta-lactamase class A